MANEAMERPESGSGHAAEHAAVEHRHVEEHAALSSRHLAALKQRLIELTRQVVVGDPTQPDTHIGAVISASQFR